MTYGQKRALIGIAAAAMLTAACAKKKVVTNTPATPAAPTPAAVTTPTPAPARTAENRPTPAAATPRSNYPDARTRARIDQLLAKVEDAYFDYDKASLRPDAMKALQADSIELRDILKDYPDYKLTIEGHA